MTKTGFTSLEIAAGISPCSADSWLAIGAGGGDLRGMDPAMMAALFIIYAAAWAPCRTVSTGCANATVRPARASWQALPSAHSVS